MKKQLLLHFNYKEYFGNGKGTSKTLRVLGVFIFLGTIVLSILFRNFLFITTGFVVMLLFLSVSSIIDLLIDIKYELLYKRLKDEEEQPKQQDAEK